MAHLVLQKPGQDRPNPRAPPEELHLRFLEELHPLPLMAQKQKLRLMKSELRKERRR